MAPLADNNSLLFQVTGKFCLLEAPGLGTSCLLQLVGALVVGVHPVLGCHGLQAVEEGVVVEAAEVLRTRLL